MRFRSAGQCACPADLFYQPSVDIPRLAAEVYAYLIEGARVGGEGAA